MSNVMNILRINKLRFWPQKNMNKEEKLNSIIMFILLTSLVGFVISHNVKLLVMGLLSIGVIVIMYGMKKKEGFDNIREIKNKANEILHESYTTPTENNPAMNVLLTDITDNPNRPPAAPSFNPIIEEEINQKTKDMVLDKLGDKKLNDKLFKDLGDNFIFEQSMRTFYPTANTQIPNDQESFARSLYGNTPSCKDGDSIACLKNVPRYTNY